MKSVFLIMIAYVFAFASWENLSEKHLVLAKKTNMPIVVYLYKDDCKYCRIFSSEALATKEVKIASDMFITTKINVGQVSSPFPYSITPTLVFIDFSGNIIANSVEGNVNAKQLRDYLITVAGEWRRLTSN